MTKIGTVKWFNDSKGYGWLTNEESTEEYFVHYTAILGEGFKTLSEGQKVSFTLLDGPRGPQAVEVTKL